MTTYSRTWNGYEFELEVTVGTGKRRSVVAKAVGVAQLSTGVVPLLHAEGLISECPSGDTCMKLMTIRAEPKYANFGPFILRTLVAIARAHGCKTVWGEASSQDTPWAALRTFYRREGFCINPRTRMFRKEISATANNWHDCI